MKTKLFALGLCAVVAFASCSKDDDPAPVYKGVSKVSESFETGTADAAVAQTGWTMAKVKGDLPWKVKTADGNLYAEQTAYKAAVGEYESWLVSPALNVADAQVKSATYDIAYGYWNDNSTLEVYVMTDSLPANNKFEKVTAGNPLTKTSVKNGWYTVTLDLSKYTGKVFIGFRYVGTDVNNSTFRIDNFRFNVAAVKGDTKENPLSVADAIANQDKTIKWVKGFVVGTGIMAVAPATGFTIKSTLPTTAEATNIVIAPSATETDPAKCIAVQLLTGGPREALNLNANFALLGKEVSIKGMLVPYFTKPGLKSGAEFAK